MSELEILEHKILLKRKFLDMVIEEIMGLEAGRTCLLLEELEEKKSIMNRLGVLG